MSDYESLGALTRSERCEALVPVLVEVLGADHHYPYLCPVWA